MKNTYYIILFWLCITGVKAIASIQCIYKSANECHYEFILPEYSLDNHHQWIPHWAMTSVPGKPQLPQTGFLVQVPENTDISTSVITIKQSNFFKQDISPAPCLLNNDFYYQKDRSVYGADQFYPSRIFQISEPSKWRGTNIVRVLIHPFQWNPVTKQLKIIHKMTFAISWPPQKNSHSCKDSKQPVDPIKSRIIMNYSPAGASTDRNKTRQQSQTVFQKLNLYIAKNCMYRLSYEALMAYQFPIKNQPHQYLQLWHRKKQIPLDIHSQTTYFQPGDHILFYGLAQEDAYTNINVYQLCWGDNQGLRMQYISAPPDDRYVFVTNAFKTVRFESNVSDHFWPNTPGAPDTDFVFWYLLNTPDSFSTTFDLPHLSKTAMTIPESYIRIAFQEKTNSFHHITIGINGHKIYEKSSHQDSQFFVEKSIDTSMLSAESNTLTIQTDLDANEFSDQLFVNLFTVRYPQSLVTHTDTSIIEMDQSGQNVSIQGFTSEQVFLYDISTPDLPKRLIAPYISKANNDYYVQFYNAAANKIYVSTDSAMKQPDMRMTHTDPLRSADNRADYIIITPQGFMQAVAPLSSYYQNRGMRVSLVSPDMIIDEFSGGIVTPQAINDFLTYAYHHWETAPSYVLMIGDSNLDYLDLFQTGKQNAVPVYVTYLDGVGLVPDDNHYVCTDGDDIIPDMTIGRLPAKNCNDVEKQVRKRLNYCKSYETASQQTLFISDNHSQDVFEKICQNAMGYLSNQMAQKLLIFRGQDNVDEFTQKIISTLNQGTLIATYMGHGSIDNWGGEHLFCSSDVHLITPGSALTFYLSLNCLSGFFALPDRYCLAQQLILPENKGAIGVIAPSGLAQVWEIDLLAQSLFALLQSNPHMPVGDLFVGAKVNAYGKGMRASSVQMFNLTGDPLVQLNIHHTKLSGDLDIDGDLTLKDVLMMFEYLGRNKDNIKPF